jgi:hypothetical protein
VTLIGDLVGAAAFLTWWLAVPRYPFLVLGPAASFLSLSPALHRVHLVATLPAVVSILIVTVILLSPTSSILARMRHLLVNFATLGMVSLLLKAGDLVVPSSQTPDVVNMVKGINSGITLALLIVSIGTAIQTMYEIVKLVDRTPR